MKVRSAANPRVFPPSRTRQRPANRLPDRFRDIALNGICRPSGCLGFICAWFSWHWHSITVPLLLLPVLHPAPNSATRSNSEIGTHGTRRDEAFSRQFTIPSHRACLGPIRRGDYLLIQTAARRLITHHCPLLIFSLYLVERRCLLNLVRGILPRQPFQRCLARVTVYVHAGPSISSTVAPKQAVTRTESDHERILCYTQPSSPWTQSNHPLMQARLTSRSPHQLRRLPLAARGTTRHRRQGNRP